MKRLIAEDDAFPRGLLEQVLVRDYELVLAQDGLKAWNSLQQTGGSRFEILDLPGPTRSGRASRRELPNLLKFKREVIGLDLHLPHGAIQ